MPFRTPSPYPPGVPLHKFPDQARLGDVILGGQDGLVNVLGIILGLVAANYDTHVIIVAGLAATFAESISMGAVAYTSKVADNDYYASERAKEYLHVKQIPEIERQEIYEIYKEKGFEGELLDKIVSHITSRPDIWIDTMMREEFGITPKTKREIFSSSAIVGFSAIVGSIIPLGSFFFLPINQAVIVSLIISSLALFGVGVYQAKTTVGHWFWTGFRIMMIGMVAAIIGFGVGWVLKVPT